VELLVTTAVIGAMSSVMVPTVQKASQNGKNAKCISNMRQIGVAVQQYVADPANGQQFPPINCDDRQRKLYGSWSDTLCTAEPAGCSQPLRCDRESSQLPCR